MQIKNIVVLLFFLIVGSSLFGQKKIKWMTWEEAVEQSAINKKKIMVDIYTQWCGWCKKMEKETFRSEFIVDYVNENFYPVKFNAEHKEDIVYKGTTYSYVQKSRRGFHELAKEIAKGKIISSAL